MILVAGSANLDFVVRAAHIPAPGETVLGRDFATFPGGKGANQAVACARAGGAPTHLLAALGHDAFAQPIEASLKSAGVVLHAVQPENQQTGTAFICVSDDAQNAITVAPGANACLAPADLPSLKGFTHLLLQLETPLATVTAYARQARAEGVCVVLNAAPAQNLPDELLDAVDILVVNEGELAALSKHQGSIAQSLEAIPVPTVVVTLGQHGCCVRQGLTIHLQPAFPIKPVDTTAAGDTFCGVLVATLSQTPNFANALRLASAAAALACTRPGAQSSIPTAREVKEFLASQHDSQMSALKELRVLCGLPSDDSPEH